MIDNKNEKGQGLVEYGLILALVSVVAMGSLGAVGEKIDSMFNKVAYPNFDSEVYSIKEIDALVANNYIPIASAKELEGIPNGGWSTFGVGTRWEDSYLPELSGKYIQVSDIDLSTINNFAPIGDEEIPFDGEFDGGGYKLSNLHVSSVKNYIGLFGRATDALFRNIRLDNIHMVGENFVGGLVGHQTNSSIINVGVTGNVSGIGSVGGLVGYQIDSSVRDSYTIGLGNVSGIRYDVGGLVGVQINSSIVGSHTKMHVSGLGSIGGLVGNQHRSLTDRSHTSGTVEGKGNNTLNVGGLVGHLYDASRVTNSYSSSLVTGDTRIGGLIGDQRSGTFVTNSYAAGRVSGVRDVGGLIGSLRADTSTVSSYYDIEGTGQTQSNGGVGKTADQMIQKSTFIDWDTHNVWLMEDGKYPILQ